MSATLPCVLIHYHEIALKRKNRGFFERKLQDNMRKTLHGLVEPKAVKREYGRLVIQLERETTRKETQKDAKILERLKHVFGIAYFAFALETNSSTKAFFQAAKKLLKKEKFTSFKVKTRRSDKKFPLSSQEINEKMGKLIKEEFKKEVNLTNPDLTIYIEVAPKKAFIYTQKIPGPGGLPVGTAGKVASLISAGFDSPVAAWYLMKRGAKVVFIHFHSYPFISKASIEQAKKLVQILTQFQFNSTLYLVPFAPIQKQIATKCPSVLRVVLYRRMMIRIAEMLARKENAKALITGESLGQVASQTLLNIKVINQTAAMPIFRPLIGMDKEEIINKARKVGTYKISVQPYDDCCSFLLPKRVATAAKIKEVESAENPLNIPKLIKDALSKVEKEKFILPSTPIC